MIRGTKEKDIETVIVGSEIELKQAIQKKKKIRFDLQAIDSLRLPSDSKYVTVSKLLDIILEDDHIPKLLFERHDWTSKELKTLAGILAKSRAITKISIDAGCDALETIFEALESNQSVKEFRLLASSSNPYNDASPSKKRKFYEKICKALITKEINVEVFELAICTSRESTIHIDQLFDALKSAKSIRSLVFTSCNAIFEKKFAEFEQLLLENKRITSLKIDTYSLPVQAIKAVTNIIKDSNITQLHLKDVHLQQEAADLFKSSIENTSITELNVSSTGMDPMILRDILIHNKTLLKLNCILDALPEVLINSIVDALEQNTSLTDLSVYNAQGIERASLKNNILKSLTIFESNTKANGDLFKRILLQNKTLTALDIRFYEAKNEDMDLIIEGLANNSTLKSFGYKIERHNEVTRRNFCKVIQDHQAITHLYTYDSVNISILQKWVPGFTEMIEEDVLQKNSSLRSWIPYDSCEQLKPYFDRNIKLQEHNIGATKTIIRMICLKPRSFVLPIEIWSFIFNFVYFPGVAMKFGELFYK